MYSTEEAADALGVSARRLDNILTGPGRALVAAGTNGRSRTLVADVLEQLAVALLLNRDLGVPIGRGLALATQLAAASDGQIAIGTLGSLHFDVVRLKAVLQHALGAVVEDRQAPRRGRPKTKRGASL